MLKVFLFKLQDMTEKKRAFMAYTLTLFPLNYFFSFLYYTDQLSTFLVLMMSYLASKDRIILSAASGKLLKEMQSVDFETLWNFLFPHFYFPLIGAYAVFTRQTNIIWVMWMAFQLTWDILHLDLPKWVKLVLLKTTQSPKEKVRTSSKNKTRTTGNEMSLLEANVLFWSKCVVRIAPKVTPYAVIVLCFVLFVITNGGIVVGDRLAHQASVNFPQLFYFAFFAGFMLCPVMILSGPAATVAKIKKHRSLFFSLIGMALVVVYINTVVHPYLLADNRHYTFYVWKRFYEWYGISRFLLVPCYVIIWFWIWACVQWDPVVFLGFLTCLAATVVPQKLLEYRYFIIPFYILRMEIKHTEWKYLISECLFYTILNIFTIYQFIMNPFVLEGKTEISRFMW